MSLFPEVDEEIKQIKAKEKLAIEDLINKSEMYIPSNGTEGDMLNSSLCGNCTKQDYEAEKYCPIWDGLYSEKQKEIREINSEVFCLSSSCFDIKDYL